MEKMFCYQCQETVNCTGCTKVGVCGKTATVSNLQDILLYATKGLSEITTVLRKQGETIPVAINHHITKNLFITITNANFDEEAIRKRIQETLSQKKIWLEHVKERDFLSSCAIWMDAESIPEDVGILAEKNEDIRGLKELITSGLKGLAAYVHHSNNLGYESEEIDQFIQKTLSTLLTQQPLEVWISLTMKTGEYGVKGMALLDTANTETYGHPEITKVEIGVRKNPGILISGHDLKDLEMLLEQTQGTGIDVYTHSEMLPAHYYPFFKKYDHFAGNYGNAWWKQKEEFSSFCGPILMTTNCLVPPQEDYKDRVYTTGATGFAGCKKIEADEKGNKDFSSLIAHAKHCLPPREIEQGELVGGFAHNQVFALADQIVEAVQSGAIRKFVVMAGCDGRMKSRNYYTEFAQSLPKDTVILTAGCAKYRYNKLNLGEINGIPRVLDAGQCNDSYSLVLIALKLQELFGLEDINDLPIFYNIAWYEQKAVIVLLALLSLGVKNIHLGPTLPAFLSPTVIDFLVENFGISGIGTIEDDLQLV